jgi:hypothetical protein
MIVFVFWKGESHTDDIFLVAQYSIKYLLRADFSLITR